MSALMLASGTDTDHAFIGRRDRARLRETLAELPWVVTELLVTEAGMGVRSVFGNGSRRPVPGSAPPTPDEASSAKAHELLAALTNEIGGWCRLVCEHRAVEYLPLAFTHPPGFIGPLRRNETRMPVGYRESLLGSVMWLYRYVEELSYTPGAETAPDALGALFRRALKVIDPVGDDMPVVVPNSLRLASANRQLVTSYSVERIATRLGPAYANLNRDRVRTLEKAGAVASVAVDPDTGTKFFRLGDVLLGHRLHRANSRRIPQ